MAWELKGTPKTQKVTAKLAKEWADMESANVDRPLSERRLGVYRRLLEQGGFRPVTWARAWCEEVKQAYRVNGKHTSTLFSSVDLSKTQDVYVVIEDYHCDTIEDVAKLYGTFDSQTQSRNASDINRSFAATIPEMADHPLKLVNLLVGAISFADKPLGGGGDTGTAAEKAERLFDEVEFCVWTKRIVEDHNKTAHLCRVPVVAAMRGSWLKSKTAATEFWLAVRDETGATPNLPDRKLSRFLLQMRVSNGSHSNIPKRFRVGPKEFYVKSIKAWNAWRKNEPTDLKYYADAKLPTFS